MSAEDKTREARAAADANKLDDACELFAEALEACISASPGNDENHISCGPAYVEYAQALLRKAQSEGDPFGGGAPIKRDGDAEDGASGEAPGGADSDDAEEPEEEGEPESDDLELSFQCFEVARLIYEKAGAGHELALAEVLEFIGEVSMENEMWGDAVGEFERSLSIKVVALKADDRQLAHLHYQLATASVAQMEKARQDEAAPEGAPPAEEGDEPLADVVTRCRAQAAAHYEKSAAVLEVRLAAAGGAPAAAAPAEGEPAEPREVAEARDLAELLAEVRAKAEEQSGPPPPPREAPPTESAEGVTTIGFGAPAESAEGVTTIGFGAPAESKEGVTTIGFGGPSSSGAGPSNGGFASSSSSLPVKNLGVVGGKDGRKKATLVPLENASPQDDDAPAAQPDAKRAKLDM